MGAACRGEGGYDFVLGNPQEMPLTGFVEALPRWTELRREDWFAYTMSVPEARAAVTRSLRERHGVPFEDEDVFLTSGAFAGLAVTLAIALDPGDQAVYLSPPWFFYETQIAVAGATPVRVSVDPATFHLDLGAIKAANGRDHRQLAEQPDRTHLPAVDPGGAGEAGRGGVGSAWAADLPPFRLGVQPDRLRRRRLPQPGRVLPAHLRYLHLRQDAAGAGHASRLRRSPADNAEPF